MPRMTLADAEAHQRQEVCCHKCSDYPPIGRVIILCPTCGNQRCPKASYHTLECTGSNEWGQPGSIYQ